MGIQPVWGTAIPFKLDFHLHMNDKNKPGVYEPWFRGLQHEREIFPGGTVDAATVKRLLASYAGEDAVTGPAVACCCPLCRLHRIPSMARDSWVLKEVEGNRSTPTPETPAPGRLRRRYSGFSGLASAWWDLTPEEKELALQIAEDNQHLIDGLPEVGGKKQLTNLLQIIVQSQL